MKRRDRRSRSLSTQASSKRPARIKADHSLVASTSGESSCIAPNLRGAELREAAAVARWTGMVRAKALRLRGEAERQRDVERFERLHLAVEPSLRVRPETVGPAQSRSDMPHA